MTGEFRVERVQRAEDLEQGFCCMTEIPTPWPAALRVCRVWASQNLGRHIEGYHARDAVGKVVGQLYYALSEQALVPYEIEPGVAVMYCEWIQRRYQTLGLARRLFSAFEADMQERNCKGILLEGTDQEAQMHYRHYLARGFEIIHDSGHRKLLYRPLSQPRVQARPLEVHVKPRSGEPVEILILSGYLCPSEASTQLLLREVAQEFGRRVVVHEESLSPETLRRYGVAGGIFINGRQKLSGATTEEAIRQAIIEEL